MNRFQLVGGRPFVIAQEPILEKSCEGCACVVKIIVVDEEIWDRGVEKLFSRSRDATVLETFDSLLIRRSRCQ